MLRCLSHQSRLFLSSLPVQNLYKALSSSPGKELSGNRNKASIRGLEFCHSTAIAESGVAQSQPSREHIESHLGPIDTGPVVSFDSVKILSRPFAVP